jgi:hypothetical protein
VEPPWGTLNAINLNTGEYVWRRPFGEYPELAAQGLKNTGTENYGGPIVTAGGLLFIAATNFDRNSAPSTNRPESCSGRPSCPAPAMRRPSLMKSAAGSTS